MSTANNDNTVSPSDEDIFNEPLQNEDCPICFLRLPTLETGKRYRSCCGKVVCSGCIHAPVYDNNGNKVKKKCPFCRAPTPAPEEGIKRAEKRMEMGDAQAITNLAGYFFKGIKGFPQDTDKALELWHQAAELGNADSYYNIGHAYSKGKGIVRDEKKAVHYYELAAIKGNAKTRHSLGRIDECAGNIDRALKHYMLASKGGYNGSLKMIQHMYKDGYATKDDYASALHAYQAYLDEIKSDQRDKAAAFSDGYKYYE